MNERLDEREIDSRLKELVEQVKDIRNTLESQLSADKNLYVELAGLLREIGRVRKEFVEALSHAQVSLEKRRRRDKEFDKVLQNLKENLETLAASIGSQPQQRSIVARRQSILIA